MKNSTVKRFPRSRIATLDVVDIGKRKHHIPALIEVDVTDARRLIREGKEKGESVSLTSWLMKLIALTVKQYESAAAYLKDKRHIEIFDDINISIIVEKEIRGKKVPIPLLVEKVQERSIASIHDEIQNAKTSVLKDKDIVLQKRSSRWERFYYTLPGAFRRAVWKRMLKRPSAAYKRMGNVSVTSIGMMGNVSSWFIPTAVHPLGFGISGITQKPVGVNGEIVLRDMLNMTILLDHDVIDGANMARFIADLSNNIESAAELKN